MEPRPDQHHLQLQRRLPAWMSKPRANVSPDGLLVAGADHVPWTDVEAVWRSREVYHAQIRRPDGRRLRVFLGSLVPKQGRRLISTWQAALVEQARRQGFLEGTTVELTACSVPRALLLLAAGGCAISGAVWIIHHLFSQLAPLLDPLVLWYHLAPLLFGAILGISILLMASWQQWRCTRQNERFSRWRLKDSGIWLKSPEGDWEHVPWQPGDRVGGPSLIPGADTIIGGMTAPVGRLSGGELTTTLLCGLAHRRGVPVVQSRRTVWVALRLLLLWVPVIGIGWNLLAHLAGTPLPRTFWMLLGGAGVWMTVLSGILLWGHARMCTQLERIASQASELLDELGW